MQAATDSPTLTDPTSTLPTTPQLPGPQAIPSPTQGAQQPVVQPSLTGGQTTTPKATDATPTQTPTAGLTADPLAFPSTPPAGVGAPEPPMPNAPVLPTPAAVGGPIGGGSPLPQTQNLSLNAPTNSGGGAAFTAPDNTTAAQVPVGTAGSTSYPVVDANGTQIGTVAYPGPWSNVNAIRAFQSGPNGGAADATTAASPQFQAAQAAAVQADTPYNDNPANAPAPTPAVAPLPNGGTVEGTVVTLPNGQQAKVVNGQLIAGAPANGQPIYQGDGTQIGTTGQSPAAYAGVPAGLPGSIGSGTGDPTQSDQTSAAQKAANQASETAAETPALPGPAAVGTSGTGDGITSIGGNTSPVPIPATSQTLAPSDPTTSGTGDGTTPSLSSLLGSLPSQSPASATLTPTTAANALTNDTITPGPATDRYQIAQDELTNWQKANAPQLQANITQAERAAAATGALGSGSLNTTLGNVANQFNLQEETQGNQFLSDALKSSIQDAYNNIGIAQQQQGFQAGQQGTAFNQGVTQTQLQSALQSTAFNQALQQFLAGSSGDPTQTMQQLSQMFSNQSAQAGQALSTLVQGINQAQTAGASSSTMQALLQQYINAMKNAPPSTGTSTPAQTNTPDTGQATDPTGADTP